MTRKVYNISSWFAVPTIVFTHLLKKLDTPNHYKDPDPDGGHRRSDRDCHGHYGRAAQAQYPRA